MTISLWGKKEEELPTVVSTISLGSGMDLGCWSAGLTHELGTSCLGLSDQVWEIEVVNFWVFFASGTGEFVGVFFEDQIISDSLLF